MRLRYPIHPYVKHIRPNSLRDNYLTNINPNILIDKFIGSDYPVVFNIAYNMVLIKRITKHLKELLEIKDLVSNLNCYVNQYRK